MEKQWRKYQIHVKTIIATIIVAAGVMAAFAKPAPTSPPPPRRPSPNGTAARASDSPSPAATATPPLLTVKLLTDRKDNVNELGLGADAAYGENNGAENAETLHGFGQWNRLFTDKFYSYARVEGLHDGIADIKYRAMIGPGAGYYLLKQTNTTLAVEAGGSMVFERLGNSDSSYETLRLAEHFEHKFAGHGARVWQRAEIMPQVDDFKNYIVTAEVGVESSIAKNLSLQTYVDDSYANQPAPGRKKNDVKLVSAISYQF